MYEEITQGPATAFCIGTAAATAPDATNTDLDALEAGTFTGFTNAGRTMGPTQFSESKDVQMVRLDQSDREVGGYNNGYTTRVRVTLGQTTMENLAVALGTSVSSGSISAPSRGWVAPVQLAVVGPIGATGDRVLLHAKRAIVISEAVVSWQGDQPQSFEVEFAILEATGGAYTMDEVAAA